MTLKTIIKTLFALTLLMPITCGAQTMEKYPGIRFTKLSNNGRYLVSGTLGATIHDRLTGQTYRYGTSYAVGLGNAVSDNGIAVFTTSNYAQPCYWKDGEWHMLSHDIGAKASIAMANGITPDGSRIVGSVDCRPVTGKAWPMNSPVLWTWDEASEEYVFEMLPEPEKDITGCAPQQVSATYISGDGKTILGQITDQRGMMEYQIIYRQGDDGKWSYETSGEDLLVKEGSVWPEYPERPVRPQSADYLTDEEKQAFNEANKAYKDSLEIVSLTGKNPRMPFYEDFLKERKDEYDFDMRVYEDRNASYLTDLYAFFDAYNENITHSTFEFNSHRLSTNGQYYVCNYKYPDPDAGVVNDKTLMFNSPRIYDIDNDENSRHILDKSMGVFAICDDGMITTGTPRNDDNVYSRESYVIPRGENPVKFADWLAGRSPEAYKWLVENMTFDVTEDGVTERSLLGGTIFMNNDGTKLIGTLTTPGGSQYLSYFMDLASSTGIDSNITHDIGMLYNQASAVLTLTGKPAHIDIFDVYGPISSAWRIRRRA